MSVSLIGGKGENILTSLEAGGGMAGATSEARSIGGRAGSESQGVESSFDSAGGCGGGVLRVRPGGERVAVEVVKKERLGLMGMGVPSSSSGVGGIVVEWDAEPRSLLVRGGVCVALALFMLELEERV